MLSLQGIDKRFGGVQALLGVGAEFAAGEVHALMGENGAGKSTLGKIIAGVYPPDAGRMLLDGRDVSFANALEAQRAGIGMIFQELDLFPHLSVAENMAVGNLNAPAGAWVSFGRLSAWCRPFLEQVELTVDLHAAAGSLPMGHQQLVAVARALSMNARYVVMDEPTSSLTHEDVEVLFRIIGKLRGQGVGIIYVSHKMDEIFRIADRITVLRDGVCVGTRRREETDLREVVRMMVGREVGGASRRASSATDEIVLAVESVSTVRLRDVSFELRRGEVLGVAGLVGSGRSEIGRALFGLDPLVSGRMRLRGADYAPAGVRDAMAAGVALQPEDRKTQGLMMRMSVQENAALSSLRALGRLGWISRFAERDATEPVHRRLQLKAASPEAAVGTLSGGNQQKVLLARWLLRDPDVLFLDDPTRGVDIGAKQDIYAMIRELAEAGKAVVFVSSELQELLRCCDRVLVMNGGTCVAVLAGAEATQEAIIERAAK